MEQIESELRILPSSSILSDIPLAKAYPNRALTCEETYLTISIRHHIQEILKHMDSGYDYMSPIVFTFNVKDIAKEKGIKNISVFKNNISKSIDTFQSNIPSEAIFYIDSKGKQNKIVIPMIAAINFNEDGSVTVKGNPDYQIYMIEHVLKKPDLQINKKLLLNSRCKYSYPLINWLMAMIAEQRQNGIFEKQYSIIAPFEEVRKKVPPASSKMTNGNYLIRVINSAVKDINENAFSNIRIINDDFAYSRKQFKIEKLIFIVEISPSDVAPIFVSYPNNDALDENNVPDWDYIENRLKMLHVNSSYISKVMSRSRAYAWEVLLYTLVRGGDARYFNKVYEDYRQGNNTIERLASSLKLARPELCDDVIDAIIMKPKGTTFKEIDETPEQEPIDVRELDFYKKFMERKIKAPSKKQ